LSVACPRRARCAKAPTTRSGLRCGAWSVGARFCSSCRDVRIVAASLCPRKSWPAAPVAYRRNRERDPPIGEP
jgi:hypothetical protein